VRERMFMVLLRGQILSLASSAAKGAVPLKKT